MSSHLKHKPDSAQAYIYYFYFGRPNRVGGFALSGG